MRPRHHPQVLNYLIEHLRVLKNRNVAVFLLIIELVAGPGIAPGLEDYEPSVLLYTTPRFY